MAGITHKSRVGETASNKPGAGAAFTLSGAAPTAFRTFASQHSANDLLSYRADNFTAGGSAWEEGVGTYTAGTLTRTLVTASSNANAAVDFATPNLNVEIREAWTADLARAGEVADLPFINGLVVSWNSATQIAVSTGAAYVEKANKIVECTSVQTLNPTLSASAWHYVYLKDDGACEVSTTAPAVAFFGTARSKNTAGQEYRWIGQFRTDASSQIYEFKHDIASNRWLYPLAASSVYRVLATGQAITSTTFSCAAFVPPQSQIVGVKVSNTDASQGCTLGDGRTVSSSVGFFAVAAGVRSVFDLPLNASQQGSYIFGAAPTGGAFVDIMSYVVGR